MVLTVAMLAVAVLAVAMLAVAVLYRFFVDGVRAAR